MASTITVATFNLENLFTRYHFRGKRIPYTENGKRRYRYQPYTPQELSGAVEDGFIIDRKVFRRVLDANRSLTAKAIASLKADVVCLQEVESLDTLKTFNSRYLKRNRFKYPLLDGTSFFRAIVIFVLH